MSSPDGPKWQSYSHFLAKNLPQLLSYSNRSSHFHFLLGFFSDELRFIPVHGISFFQPKNRQLPFYPIQNPFLDMYTKTNPIIIPKSSCVMMYIEFTYRAIVCSRSACVSAINRVSLHSVACTTNTI